MSQQEGSDERPLGMGRPITRRDFLDGVLQAVGGAGAVALATPAQAQAAGAAHAGTAPGAMPAAAGPAAAAAPQAPPRRQGLRGFDAAAMEAGHAVRDGRALGTVVDTGEAYDLVVVGAGMSGLAAAYFYREQRPGAKVLVLDGCDDFGGHARRVEFDVDGRQLLVCGGTQELWNLNTFPPESLRMLEAIGIDRARYAAHRQADKDALDAMGLRAGTFFDRETFGVDRLVLTPAGPLTPQARRAYYDQTPLPVQVKADMVRMYTDLTDPMAGLSVDEKVARLRRMSYTDFLRQVVGLSPGAVAFHDAGWGNDIDNASAGYDTMSAWTASRLHPAAFARLGLPKPESRSNLTADVGELIQFPDGNAGVARLLIRHLVPGALPGHSAEDSIRAEMRYDRLDRQGNEVRIRLSSLVLRTTHVGDPGAAREVEVTYLRDGRVQRVRAGAAVMACFNAMVPHLVPELPETQKAALRLAVRKAQMRTFVAIRNWRAFEKLGVYGIGSRGMPLAGTSQWLMPEWGGAYRNARTPDEPILLMMNLSRHVLERGRPGCRRASAGRRRAQRCRP